jgi:flagellar motor protein MotB
MRVLRRQLKNEEDEESVFVPMTDMTVSFLFIVMILLAFFAVQFSEEDTIPRSIFDDLNTKYVSLEDRYNILLAEEEKYRKLYKKTEKAYAELNKKHKNLEEKYRKIAAKKELFEQKYNSQLIINAELMKVLRQLKVQLNNQSAKITALNIAITNLKEKLAELLLKKKDKNPLESYVIQAQVQRQKILELIRNQLKVEFGDEIAVELSRENDALRFKGEGLFDRGSSDLILSKKEVIRKVGSLLTAAISCYTVNPFQENYQDCNPYGIIIEAVQIEGHTDSDGLANRNIRLSTDRANSAYFEMLNNNEDFLEFRNIRNQPVVSVAGYGQMRPVASNGTIEGKAENRRIDLRRLMYTPVNTEQVQAIQKNISEGLKLAIEAVTNEP